MRYRIHFENGDTVESSGVWDSREELEKYFVGQTFFTHPENRLDRTRSKVIRVEALDPDPSEQWLNNLSLDWKHRVQFAA